VRVSQLPTKGGLVLALVIANGATQAPSSAPGPAAASGRPLSASQVGNRFPSSIELTVLPPSGTGNPKFAEDIEGTVKGAMPRQRIVLYGQRGDVWWVQPLAVAVPKATLGPPPRRPESSSSVDIPRRVRTEPGEQGGPISFYDPDNVSIDSSGLLHLRVTERDGKRMSAQVDLSLNLCMDLIGL
jgi:hypothetical protein